MRLAVASLSVLSSILLLSCLGEVCTLAECEDAFEVRFTGSTTKTGVYEIGVVTDGVASTCEITLPRACGVEPMYSRSDLPWTVRLSGCPKGGAETIMGLVFESAPLTVEFVVRRDGLIVGEGKVRPEYMERQLNGPGCGTCRSAPHHMTELAP